MKYGIYKGAVVKVTGESGSILHVHDGDDSTCIGKGEILEVSEEDYKAVEQELAAARDEVKGVTGRIYRLDEEYHKKKNALMELLMSARNKEMSVVSRLIKTSQQRCQKNEGYEEGDT